MAEDTDLRRTLLLAEDRKTRSGPMGLQEVSDGKRKLLHSHSSRSMLKFLNCRLCILLFACVCMSIVTTSNLIGLKIRQGEQLIASYKYGHAGDSKPVDWKVLAAEDEVIEGEHIRCLPLKEGEDLGQLVEQFQSAHAKAIVFVNSREDFMVEAQQWPHGSAISVLLLKASDGKQLLSTVDMDRAVFGQVQVESHVDAGPTPLVAVTQEPTATQAVQPVGPLPEKDKEGRYIGYYLPLLIYSYVHGLCRYNGEEKGR